VSDSLSITMPNLGGFERAAQIAPSDLNSELLVATRRISAQAEGIAKVAVPVDTGNLKSTIYGRGEITATGARAVWGASAEYAAAVDKGRRAGAKMPPAGVLLPWMGAKAIDPSFEYPIRAKIKRDGIKARPFVTKAFRDLTKGGFTSTVYSEFRAAIKRTLAKFPGGHG
jgi:hypothetical protein